MSCKLLLYLVFGIFGYIRREIEGAPEISLTLAPSPNVFVNQTITLECRSSTDIAGVSFTFPVNIGCLIDFAQCKKCGTAISVECPDNRTYRLVLIVQASWNNGNMFCESPFGGSRSENVTLNVTVPVTSVTLAPVRVSVDAGEEMILTCQTSNCYPRASIRWYKESVDITNNASSETVPSSGLVSTRSTLQYRVMIQDNKQLVYCSASNIQGNRVNSTTHQLDVRRLVTSVILTPTQTTVDAGKQITLTCQTDYCNPAANITWYKASAVLTTPTTDTTDTDSNDLIRSTSVLRYTGVAGDNGQQVYCKASNRQENSVESNKYTLNVRYPPSTKPIITASPEGLRYNTGTTVTLTCQLSGGNPVATLSWRCKNTDMKGTSQSNSTTAVSVLSLVMDSSYNNQHCTCTASHSVLTSLKSSNVSLTVFYPPSSSPVITASPSGLRYDNGTRVTLTCQLPGGNPVATLSWRCKNTDMKGTNQSNSTTAVSVLSLVMDSSYNNQHCTCTASHSVLTSPKSSNVSLTVFYNNVIISSWNQTYAIKEQGQFQLDCEVDGNPLSNITWVFVRNNTIIKRDYHVSKSSLDISSLNCVDYGTYRVIADNGKSPHANKTTKLSVKCKPRLYTTDSLTPVKLGIGNNESLRIFVRILLFPPAIKTTWNLSRTINESRVIKNSTDGYRINLVKGDMEQNITLYKKSVNTEDFGNYTLGVENEIGLFTRIYHVDSARPPLLPTNFTVLCENSLAIKLTWISNFNGGNVQNFTISYSTDLKESFYVLKRNIRDEGYGKSHSYIPSIELQGVLWFTLTASNNFGNTISDAIDCNAVKKKATSSDNLLVIAGAATGGLIFAGLVILGIVLFLRTMNESGGKKKDIHQSETILTEERESDEDDGLKENKLYISAGPRDDEKQGISETAVYAEVNKKGHASDNNANVYAEVQKSGKTSKDKVALYSDTTKPKKGFLKKEDKPKQKKAKKMKQNKGVTDVYENPEDIVMTQNLDNVYSNTAASNGKKSEKHGYKNQDGLLYVEVQFDQKLDSGKPVIHGEDEKTDYATVEFPFPPSSNNDKPTDEK